MNKISYQKFDIINGNGARVVLWLAGCSHGCKGCFSKQSHDPKSGTKFTEEDKEQLIQDLSKPYITGITFSGGDPCHKRNYKEVIELCKRIKKDLPDKDIILYTGYTYEQLIEDEKRKELLLWCDQLMDGKYEHDNPTTKSFRGSDNQILHTLSEGISIEQN